jgi:hypothetical protein
VFDSRLSDPGMASIEVFFQSAWRRSNQTRPSVWLRSWTVAMMCRTRLIWRLQARDNRCRTWSPNEASIGAVPFPEANGHGQGTW